MSEDGSPTALSTIELASEITIAWLSNPNVRASAEDVPTFLKALHATIGELSAGPAQAPAVETPDHAPAVPVRSSVKPDYLVSLITGQKFKALKRHLASQGLTPDEYRERYGLKSDYPMVAANYSASRRDIAQKLGLGRKRAEVGEEALASLDVPAPAQEPVEAAEPVKKRGATAKTSKAASVLEGTVAQAVSKAPKATRKGAVAAPQGEVDTTAPKAAPKVKKPQAKKVLQDT